MRALLRTLAAHGELAKVRLSLLVVVTTAAGFLLAEPHGWGVRLALTCFGTALAAAGAMALNQALEVERDRRMARTAHRPLVTGFFSRRYGTVFGLGAATAGLGLLLFQVNALTAALGLAVVLLYVLVYTPLKVRTPFCTLVGAVCGALPPMMGWAAARGQLQGGAFLLAALLFFWQIPHFLSLAWLYRDDYRRGGFRMLPEVDPQGQLTARFSLLYGLATVATTLSFVAARLAGPPFAVAASALGVLLLAPAYQLLRGASQRAARKLFLATLAYLPLVLAFLVWERHTWAGSATAVTARATLHAPLTAR